MLQINKKNTVHPNILVLEGLWDDTSHAIRAAGGDPYEETPWTVDDSFTDLDTGYYHGMVLTGGSDICPSLYDETPCREVYGIDKLRDFMEYQALSRALELGIPVLGICRGSQIMTAFRGGSLTQDIPGHRSTDHTVYAASGARTFKRAINSRQMECISLHHQCVRDPGPGMRIAAFAADGTPEAVESKDGLWLGVQFHPELAAFDNGNAFAIFQWLVREAAKHAGGPAPSTRFRDAKRNERERKALVKAVQPAPKITADGPPYSYQKQLPQSTSTSTSRQAGEPSLPSMRDMTRIIERSVYHSESELQVCSSCGLLFDNAIDCHDHEMYVCGTGTCEPPEGHPAWYVH